LCVVRRVLHCVAVHRAVGPEASRFVKVGVSLCAAGTEFDYNLPQAVSEAARIADGCGWPWQTMQKVAVARDDDIIAAAWDAGLHLYATAPGLSPDSIFAPCTTVLSLPGVWRCLGVSSKFHANVLQAARVSC
jgi:hypothetical protein